MPVVSVLDVVADRLPSLFDGSVQLEAYFFGFQGFEEALCQGIVIWAAGPTHADADPVCLQDFDILVGSILTAAIRVMHHWRHPRVQSSLDGFQCQPRIEVASQSPAHATAAVRIENDS